MGRQNKISFQNSSGRTPMYMVGDNIQGLKTMGNIDIANRPTVLNNDGSVSTVRTMGVTGNDGLEYLIPTVSDDGRIMGDNEAYEQFMKTGKHFGAFDSIDASNNYAQMLHDQQNEMYGDKIRQLQQQWAMARQRG